MNLEEEMINRLQFLCGTVLAVTLLGACTPAATPPRRETTTTTTIACPPGKTLLSDGMCR
jgi:hypothetical protein